MYDEWARIRLDATDDVVIFSSGRNGDFGFTCMNYYSGLMAQPSRTGKNKGIVKRAKQGLFDIVIFTGNRYSSGVSHRMILEDVVNNTSLDKCFRVWRGENPIQVGEDEEEREVLVTLALLFFEQEINWGKEKWQRYTYFYPKVRTPKRVRPRDMLMGYVLQAYDLGIDNIAYWQLARPTTTTFISPDGTNYGFEDYPLQYKRYFTELEDDAIASALMTGDILKLYRHIANQIEDNPYYRGE